MFIDVSSNKHKDLDEDLDEDEVLDEDLDEVLDKDPDEVLDEQFSGSASDPATCIYWCNLLHVYFSDFC